MSAVTVLASCPKRRCKLKEELKPLSLTRPDLRASTANDAHVNIALVVKWCGVVAIRKARKMKQVCHSLTETSLLQTADVCVKTKTSGCG